MATRSPARIPLRNSADARAAVVSSVRSDENPSYRPWVFLRNAFGQECFLTAPRKSWFSVLKLSEFTSSFVDIRKRSRWALRRKGSLPLLDQQQEFLFSPAGEEALARSRRFSSTS